MSISFEALPTTTVRALQAGGLDANGQKPERQISDGDGVPCRHCLQDVAKGEPYLVLGFRPFPEAQPYAEVGPIFLHAEPCRRFAGSATTPAPLLRRARHLVKGYRADNRIYYGKCDVVPAVRLESFAEELLADPEVAYVHVRSAVNNCYTCKIVRA